MHAVALEIECLIGGVEPNVDIAPALPKSAEPGDKPARGEARADVDVQHVTGARRAEAAGPFRKLVESGSERRQRGLGRLGQHERAFVPSKQDDAEISLENPSYRTPLERTARELASRDGDSEFVLLGSVASDKYVQVLSEIFGTRLVFPTAFVGRGDMSRGGLLLRMAAAGTELEYAPVSGTVLRGRRPPKLPPLRSTR